MLAIIYACVPLAFAVVPGMRRVRAMAD